MNRNQSFRQKVNQAIVEARKFLGTARAPALPENVSHTYDDKYLLAEIGTRSTILALRNALDHTSQGAFTANLPLLTTWMRDGKTITMQTEAEELCAFVKTTTRDVKSTTSQVTGSTGFLDRLFNLASVCLVQTFEISADFSAADKATPVNFSPSTALFFDASWNAFTSTGNAAKNLVLYY